MYLNSKSPLHLAAVQLCCLGTAKVQHNNVSCSDSEKQHVFISPTVFILTRRQKWGGAGGGVAMQL